MCLRGCGCDRSGVGQGVLGLRAALLKRIAAHVGTPTYVYSADLIRTEVRQLQGALARIPHSIFYSMKANSNLSLLGLLRGLGVGVDIVSGGELERALAAGFAPDDIVFSGVGKSPRELERAVEVGVGLINLESAGELQSLRGVTEAMARKANVGVRVNPGVTIATHPYTQTGAEGMKFGIPVDEVLDIARDIATSPYLQLASIGMHLGSQIAAAHAYAEGATKLGSLIAELRGSGVDTLRSVDVGGGMAIPYGDRPGLPMSEFVEAVAPIAVETGLTLLLEPGRLLVGNAGALITRVLYCKRSGGRTFAVVDAGMNDFMRPSYYQAEHPISVIGADDAAPDSLEPVDVVGPICETGDYLGLARRLPGLKPGALLAVHAAGAYGFSMSSTYNSRPRAAEVLVDGERVGLIRARETIEDLWNREVAEPQWLPSL